jgi:hypothetical protein
METEYLQVILKFEEESLKKELENKIINMDDKSFSIDYSLDEALAVDPLTLGLIIGIIGSEVTKATISEIVKWIFEKIKDIGSNKDNKSTNQKIPIKVKIKGKNIKIIYDTKTRTYTYTEQK